MENRKRATKTWSPLIAHARRRFFGHLKKAREINRTQGFKQLIKIGFNKIFPKKSKSLVKAIQASQNIPKASIIIPVFNAVEYTKACISSIYSVSCDTSFEIIVVDNNSTDQTHEVLVELTNKHTNIRYVRLNTNKGFSGAVNVGITSAVSNYLVILNNDTIVSNYWLDRLIAAMQSDSGIGIISPVTNYIGEGPQIDQLAVEICVDQIDAWSDHIKDRPLGFQPSRLVFFCCLIQRSVIDQIGLLDEQYLVGNYEDDDYCLRTIMAGYKLAIANNSFVYHHGSKTFEKNRIDHTDRILVNRDRFFRKSGRMAVSAKSANINSTIPLISVIVRTVNRPELLIRALTSLSNQTYRKFEVVLINDNGPDLSSLIARFDGLLHIFYIPQTSSVGRTQALNIGVEKSRGEWLCFLDDDDIFYPWHLATFIDSTSEQKQATFLYSDYNQAVFSSPNDEDPLILRGIEPWNFDRNDLMIRNFVPINTWLLNREIGIRTGLFDCEMDLLEDYEFLLRLSQKSDLYHIQKTTCEYRFYLDGVNSIIMRRPETLAALKTIYHKFPSNSDALNQERLIELATLEKQIKKINRLISSKEDQPNLQKGTYQDILEIILGV